MTAADGSQADEQGSSTEKEGPKKQVPEKNESDLKLDSAVVASLYIEHSDELRRMLIGILRDVQLAHDVLQAAFAKLIEQGHTTREGSRKAWLYRVAYNEAMLVRRRAAVGDKILRKESWSRGIKEGMTADEPVLRLEAVEAVRAAMLTLPPEQCQIVRMRIYDEKTFVEIARELNIPLGTALARMHSALAKLRERLKDK